ncbi:MAG: hypothetical protein BJ554DRAFT_6457 [Olpidium bornovanus]|uniref:Uncharacterized protein n=1 Tax=Olpidium bornovanus TaxID=278681 RepID=A0A8H7ZXQ8_9FUNG|nr:MAG: hypothetical protein BJ554DRAFT_6457 [Olpidium bornovanus]KAG5461366.1 MAG: hypothetical protein BJ554DRAFT_6457 [Olpidium bornovanus]
MQQTSWFPAVPVYSNPPRNRIRSDIPVALYGQPCTGTLGGTQACEKAPPPMPFAWETAPRLKGATGTVWCSLEKRQKS